MHRCLVIDKEELSKEEARGSLCQPGFRDQAPQQPESSGSVIGGSEARLLLRHDFVHILGRAALPIGCRIFGTGRGGRGADQKMLRNLRGESRAVDQKERRCDMHGR